MDLGVEHGNPALSQQPGCSTSGDDFAVVPFEFVQVKQECVTSDADSENSGGGHNDQNFLHFKIETGPICGIDYDNNFLVSSQQKENLSQITDIDFINVPLHTNHHTNQINNLLSLSKTKNTNVSEGNLISAAIHSTQLDKHISRPSDSNVTSANVTRNESEPTSNKINLNVYQCPDCKIMFIAKVDIETHIGCSISSCMSNFLVATSLTHFEAQQKQYPANCKTCSINYVEKRFFNDHLKTHVSIQQKYMCKICKNRFISLCQLKKHQIFLNHVYGSDCSASLESKRPKVTLLPESSMGADEGGAMVKISVLKCPHCIVYFETSAQLEKHLGMDSAVTKGATAGVVQSLSAAFGTDIESIQRIEVDITEFDTQNEPKKCDVCSTKFLNLEILNDHKCNHDDVVHPIICDMKQCTKKFLYLCQLNRHKIKNKHRDKFIDCPLCHRKFANIGHLKQHITFMHSNDERFDDNAVRRKGTLAPLDSSKTLWDYVQQSLEKKNNDKISKCVHCPLTFRNAVDLVIHIDNVHGNISNNLTKDSIVDLTMQSDEEWTPSVSETVTRDPVVATQARHVSTYRAKRDASDDNSPQQPPAKISKLQVALESEPREVDFIRCVSNIPSVVPSQHPESQSNSNAQTAITGNVVNHKYVFVYKCPYCCKYIKNDDAFRSHIELNGYCDINHYKIKISLHEYKKQLKYECSNCKLSFLNFDTLGSHEQGHLGKTACFDECKLCSTSKLFLCSLIEHQKSMQHDVGIYQCSFCESKFCNKTSLNDHIVALHDGKLILNCQACPAKFEFVSKLMDHLKNKHRIVYMTCYSEMVGVCIDKNYLNKCNLCKAVFEREDALESHFEHFHKCRKPNSISCPECSHKFSNLCFVNQHVAVSHSGFSLLALAEKAAVP